MDNCETSQVVQVPRLNKSLTLPAVIADTELLSSQVTIAVTWAATVILAVWNVAGFSFPVIVTLTINPTGGRVCWTAPSVAWTIVGTRVDPEGDTVEEDMRKDLLREGGDTTMLSYACLHPLLPNTEGKKNPIYKWKHNKRACVRRSYTEVITWWFSKIHNTSKMNILCTCVNDPSTSTLIWCQMKQKIGAAENEKSITFHLNEEETEIVVFSLSNYA